MIPYVLKQQTKKDGLWTSEVFRAADYRDIKQAVVAGFIQGEQRWAEYPDGTFICGIEANGKAWTP